MVLTGIHLSSYGVDFEEGRKETLLPDHVRYMRWTVSENIRLGSLEPRIITDENLRRPWQICQNSVPHFSPVLTERL